MVTVVMTDIVISHVVLDGLFGDLVALQSHAEHIKQAIAWLRGACGQTSTTHTRHSIDNGKLVLAL